MRTIKKLIPVLLILFFTGSSCKKYVDVTNPDVLVDPGYWKNENSVRSYAWEFYGMFNGFGNGSSTSGDFYFPGLIDDQVSVSFSQFPQTTPATNGDWFFGYVRKANIMLERIDQVDMSEEAKNHWKGIARFFRALQYFKLVQTFGGVPFYSHSVDFDDSTQLYKPRDSRQLVMDSILADINFAVANLRQKDLANTVNKDVANALKSRIGLYEGTYRKYHTELSLPEADKFLQAAKDGAQAIMSNSAYTLAANYQTSYNSDDLSADKEMILYKRYEAGLLQHSTIAYNYSSTTMNGLSKSAVESYPAVDGLPISVSPLYQGDDDISKIMANRDKRLKITVDSTFLFYMGHIKSGLTSSTGYRPTKFLPDSNKLKTIPTGIGTGITDAPLFWLAEIYLNYAEAAAELDQLGKYTFVQADLDNSINKLRARAGVAKLVYVGSQNVSASGTPFVDPKKDADVSSLVWEIRRERRVELMMDGFRFQDLMRWKKGSYLSSTDNPDAFLGAKVPANGTVKLNPNGYIQPFTQVRTFVDPKNYLSAIPPSQILLYPPSTQAGMQNPGW